MQVKNRIILYKVRIAIGYLIFTESLGLITYITVK